MMFKIHSDSDKELDEIIFELYQCGRGDMQMGGFEYENSGMPELKQRLNALIEKKVREANKYQIGVRLVNERREIWGLNIAHKGRCVFGDIYKSEQKAYDAIPTVIAQLQDNQGKG